MKNVIREVVISAFIGGLAFASAGEPAEKFEFRNVYGNNMVLQRDRPIRLSGTADAGKTLKVAMLDRDGKTAATAEVVADADGDWKVALPALPAGGPYRVTLTGAAERTVALENVLMGDVWLCSGQSNMEMPVWGNDKMYREQDGDRIAAEANDDRLRLFLFNGRYIPTSSTPEPELKNVYSSVSIRDCWRPATNANSVGCFSSTGYFFGRELRKRLDVPVGLICCARGATQISLWMSDSAHRRYEGKDDFIPPKTLHNAMVHPFTAFPIKGVIWYQGCSDAHMPVAYGKMLRCWLAGLREEWNQPDLPCVIVQLARFVLAPPPGRSWKNPFTDEELAGRGYVFRNVGYAPMREVQTEMLDEPHCGVSCSVDLGEALDIHPHDKKDFAPRIAAEAMRVAYGSKAVTHGPRLRDVRFAEGRAVVSFADLGQGLATRDGQAPQACLIAGENKAFYPAEARIEGDALVLSSPKVADPKYVRYAWQDYCHNPNLINRDGFPAYPFRTDGAHGEYNPTSPACEQLAK